MPTVRHDAIRVITQLCTAYDKPIEPELVESYVPVLIGHDEELLTEAVQNLQKSSQWIPRPTEIYNEVRRLTAEASRGTAEPDHWKIDTYQCRQCNDTGHVTVWSPNAMKQAIKHVRGDIDITKDRRLLHEAVAKCTCAIGKRQTTKAAELRSPPMVIIDRTQTVEQRIDDLVIWAKHHTGRA